MYIFHGSCYSKFWRYEHKKGYPFPAMQQQKKTQLYMDTQSRIIDIEDYKSTKTTKGSPL